MVGTEASHKFRQMFHDTVAGISGSTVESGKISIGTETNWNQDTATQNSYYTVTTREAGTMYERFRIGTVGAKLWQ